MKKPVFYKMKVSAKKNSKYIEEQVEAYNFAQVPPEKGAEEEDLVFKITNDKGEIIAGCILEIYQWKVADLDILWVSEPFRRQGLGSALIKRAEEAAREKGCYAVILGTFDFQARPLYEKHGYTLTGINRDCPKGHENYSMMKRLDRPSKTYVPSKTCAYEIQTGTEEDGEFIGDGLGAYNDAQTNLPDTYIKLNRKLVDENGKLVAAIMAGVDGWGIGCVFALWVEEAYRKQGLGSRLLRHFEETAKKKGAYMTHVFKVFDWQADFFKKNGYTVGGNYPDVPRGHAVFEMQKEL